MVDSFPICRRDLGAAVLYVQDTGYFSSNWLLLLNSSLCSLQAQSASLNEAAFLSQAGQIQFVT